MKGFTLVETLIAVTILSLAVAGPIYSASRSIIAAQLARDQLVASSLAQEGLEYIRLMRDDEYLAAYQAGGTTVSTTAWNNFLTGADTASITRCISSVCTLDPSRPMGTGSTLALAPCAGAACGPLYVSNGIYTQQSGLPGAKLTRFTRTVQATAVSNTDEKIVSKVSWTFHGTPYSVTVSDHLTPWQ